MLIGEKRVYSVRMVDGYLWMTIGFDKMTGWFYAYFVLCCEKWTVWWLDWYPLFYLPMSPFDDDLLVRVMCEISLVLGFRMKKYFEFWCYLLFIHKNYLLLLYFLQM